jgi:hypothetical protein
MVRSVGTAVATALALHPTETVRPAGMTPSQLRFVAVAWFPCSVMTAAQTPPSDVGVGNVHRSVHPLIAGPLFVMSTFAVNPPAQLLVTVYVQVTPVSAVAGRATAISEISVAAAVSQTRQFANRINFQAMAALYIRMVMRTTGPR